MTNFCPKKEKSERPFDVDSSQVTDTRWSIAVLDRKDNESRSFFMG